MKPVDTCTVHQFCNFYTLNTSDVTAMLKSHKSDLGEIFGYHSEGAHCKKKPLYSFDAVLQVVSGFYPNVGFVHRARAFLVGQQPTLTKASKRFRGSVPKRSLGTSDVARG